jgi:GntR family transcriptional regulator
LRQSSSQAPRHLTACVDMDAYRPRYREVTELLRSRIESGHFPVGSTLAPEVELAKTFGVSRATMRRAILELVEDGLLKRRPRVGTVVIRSRKVDDRSYFRGITEDLRSRGISSTVTVLKVDLVTPTPAIAEELQLPVDEQVLRLVRVRKLAGVPFGLLTSYVPRWVGLKPTDDFARPLYRLIEATAKVHITYGHDVLGAAEATPEVAAALDVPVGSAVLRVRRTAYVDRNRPVEYVQSYLRSDLYEYHVVLPREPDRPGR